MTSEDIKHQLIIIFLTLLSFLVSMRHTEVGKQRQQTHRPTTTTTAFCWLQQNRLRKVLEVLESPRLSNLKATNPHNQPSTAGHCYLQFRGPYCSYSVSPRQCEFSLEQILLRQWRLEELILLRQWRLEELILLRQWRLEELILLRQWRLEELIL